MKITTLQIIAKMNQNKQDKLEMKTEIKTLEIIMVIKPEVDQAVTVQAADHPKVVLKVRVLLEEHHQVQGVTRVHSFIICHSSFNNPLQCTMRSKTGTSHHDER